jgi:anti-sigma B factor antagonist
MSHTLTQTDDRLLVELEGQLDIGNRQAFKDAVTHAMTQGVRLVIVDCARVTFIDSSGLGALVSLSKRLREVGGDLRLCALTADLWSLFELTRLDAIFPQFASRDDAMAGA